jgi:phage terminase large subunit
MHTVDANNDVEQGIQHMTSEMRKGTILIMEECKNTIREIESYVWDTRASEKGYDEPMKKDDHSVDALRYALATHKISVYEPYKHKPNDYMSDRFGPGRRI